MALCFSPFFTRGMAMYLRASRGGSQSTGTFPFLSTQYSDKALFYISATDTTT